MFGKVKSIFEIKSAGGPTGTPISLTASPPVTTTLIGSTSSISSGTIGYNTHTGNFTTTSGASAFGRRYPDSWTVYSGLPSDYEDSAESPLTGMQIFIANIAINSTIGRFHFDLFAKIHPQIKYEFIGTGLDSSSFSISNVAFLTQEDFNTFDTWLNNRIAVFGSRERLYANRFAPPPTRLGETTQIEKIDHESLIEVAAWMIDNCLGEIYSMGNYFVFTNEDDAMLYKMKYFGSDIK